MTCFDGMRPVAHNLYRGSSGKLRQAVMSVAIGPAFEVAQFIADHVEDVPVHLHDDVYYTIERLLGAQAAPNKPQPFNAQRTLQGRIEHLLRHRGIARNHITVFEHVVGEETVQSIQSGQRLESTSRKPQIACLYAYGVRIDDWLQGRQRYWGNGPNQDAFVVIVDRDHEQPLARAYSFEYAGEKFGVDECERRIKRDQEVLLSSAEKPGKVIPLPPFNDKDPVTSLHDAALALQQEGAAVL